MKTRFLSTAMLLVIALVLGCSKDDEPTPPTPKNQAPTALLLSNPENNATEISTTPTLQWTKATDPDGDAVVYDVFLGTTNPPNLAVSESQTDNTFRVSNEKALEHDTTYYWYVVAKDNNGEATKSDVYAFATKKGAPKGRIYISNKEELFYLDVSTGEKTSLVSGDFRGIQIYDNALYGMRYVNTNDYDLEKRAIDTGEKIWNVKFKATPTHYFTTSLGMQVFDDQILYGYNVINKTTYKSISKKIIINPKDGTIILSGRTIPEPLIGYPSKRAAIKIDNTVFALSGNQGNPSFYGHNLSDHSEVHKLIGERVTLNKLYKHKNQIIFSTWNNKLYAYDSKLNQKWQANIRLSLDMTFRDEVAYVSTRDNGIYAINTANGNPLWNTPIAIRDALISLSENRLFIYTKGSYYVLNANTGKIERAKTDMPLKGEVSDYRGNVWAFSDDYFVFQFHKNSGDAIIGLYKYSTAEILWQHETKTSFVEVVDENFEVMQ